MRFSNSDIISIVVFIFAHIYLPAKNVKFYTTPTFPAIIWYVNFRSTTATYSAGRDYNSFGQ